MSDQIRACPFCGSIPIVDGKSEYLNVRCESCGVKGRSFHFDSDDEADRAEELAIIAWSRRAEAGKAAECSGDPTSALRHLEQFKRCLYTAPPMPAEPPAPAQECSGDPTDAANKWHCPKCGVSSQWFDRIAKESAQDSRQRFEAWVMTPDKKGSQMLDAWAAWQEASRQMIQGEAK